MATYPYVSGAGALVSAIERLGKQFAGVVTADTLEQLGIAPVRRAQHPCRPSAPRPRAVDDGHDAQTTSEALKFLDEEVQRISSLKEIGRELMTAAFNENNPKLVLNTLATAHEQNEQEGFKYLFAGTQVGIRNPWGHESGVVDGPATCLDHRSSASKLLRRLDTAGLTYRPSTARHESLEPADPLGTDHRPRSSVRPVRGRNDWQTPLGSGVTALICGVICFWKLALGPGVPFVIVGFFAVAALGITVGIRRFRRRGQTGGGPTDFGSFK